MIPNYLILGALAVFALGPLVVLAFNSAAAMMMILPIIVIFLSLQRQFISGLTAGGLKG